MGQRTNILACLAIVLGLAAASVMPAPYATLWPDTVRDLSAALTQARWESLVLAGPPINMGPRIGPISVWMQAVALAIFPTLTAAAMWFAIVSALKFPLLFLLGRVVQGNVLGLCFAVAAAVPSIAAYYWIVFFHPNWVETGIVATLLCVAVAVKKRSVAWAQLSAATLGFAMQLHPTALFYAPAVGFALLASVRGRGRLAIHCGLATLLVLVWFVPLLFADGLGQARGAENFGTRLFTGLQAFSVGDVFTVLHTAYYDVPLAIGSTYLSTLGIPGWTWDLALAAVAVAGGAGLIMRLADPGLARFVHGGLLAALLLAWVIACAVRTYTSFYLCFFILPLSAIVLGGALERLVTAPSPWARSAGWTALALATGCSIMAALGAWSVGQTALIESRLPFLMDLRHPVPGSVRAWIATAASRDGVAKEACRRGGAAPWRDRVRGGCIDGPGFSPALPRRA
jgi:hypothetical protein